MSNKNVGVVVIGRNEGARLGSCLQSVRQSADVVVYVDSASIDDSVTIAKQHGVHVVTLDPRMPLNAARARNEGFRFLRRIAPTVLYVQFVDGDCEVARTWIDTAARFLDTHRDVVAVCGRLRERYPENSVYNMLCDIEWDAPTGNISACAGNALMRVEAFETVGGYRGDVPAGEEPELCARLRANGGTIWRLSDEMGVHDAAMSRFGEWWRRTVRCGYGYAQLQALHGSSPERLCVRESRSAWLWALVVPTLVAALTVWWGTTALLLSLVYPLQIARIALGSDRPARQSWSRAAFLMLGKFAEFCGQLKFLLHRVRHIT